MKQLQWENVDCGAWQAESALHDEGSPFLWRIHVGEDGQFVTDDSDGELIPHLIKQPSSSTLLGAKVQCQDAEDQIQRLAEDDIKIRLEEIQTGPLQLIEHEPFVVTVPVRDLFIAAVLTGMYANPQADRTHEDTAEEAVRQADIVMKVRGT